MIRHECKKIFIRQKAIYYVLILMAVKVLSILVSGYDSHYMIDENETYYLEYIAQYEGEITEETKIRMEEEYNRIYRNTETDYFSASQEKAFQVIYHQYLYQSDGGGGYILDTRGWESILEHDNIDYVLLIGIILISTLLFATEYETDMQMLLLTSKYGKYRVTSTKLLIGIITAGLLSAVFQGMEYLYLKGTVGLAHGEYPLLCLEFFEDAIWNGSLWQACLFVFLIKIMGVFFVSLTAMLIVIFLKQAVLSLIVASFVYLIADVLTKQGSIGYYTPLGFLKAAGYLWPAQYEAGIDESGIWIKIDTFHSIPHIQTVVCIGLLWLLMLILFYMCYALFSRTMPRFLFWKQKKIIGAICLCILLCCSTGCGKSESMDEAIEVSMYTQEEYTDGSYTLKIDYESNNIICWDGQEEYYLIRDVFPLSNEITRLFVSDDCCYYLMENTEDNGIYIRCVDLQTFSDEFIYSNMNENNENFYGLLSDSKTVEEIFDNVESVQWFFVADEYIFLQKNDTIRRINRYTGYSKVIAEQSSDETVMYYQGILKYVDFAGENRSCR